MSENIDAVDGVIVDGVRVDDDTPCHFCGATGQVGAAMQLDDAILPVCDSCAGGQGVLEHIQRTRPQTVQVVRGFERVIVAREAGE